VPTYRFEAFTKEGTNLRGELEAVSSADAERLLIARPGIAWVTQIQTLKAGKRWSSKLLAFKLSTTDLEIFSYQMGILLKAGMNIDLIFGTLIKSLPSPRLVAVVQNLEDLVRKGVPLHQAFRSSGLFSEFYVSMVHAGEASGNLDRTFLKLAQFYRKLGSFTQKLIQTLIYPVFVMGAGIGVFIMAEVVVLPKFQMLYTQLNVPLPPQTRLLIALSHFMRTQWPWLIVLLVLLAVGLQWMSRDEKNRIIRDRWMLNFPLVGKVIHHYESLVFCYSLGNLVGSGILLTDALTLCHETIHNEVLKRNVEVITKEIRKGKSLSEMLRETHLVPPVAEQLLATGDTSGQIGDLSQEASEYLENELSASVEKFVAGFGPALLVLVAGGIGFLLFSLYLPIFGAAQHIVH